MKTILQLKKSPLVGAVINARGLTLAAVVMVISGALASPAASANAQGVHPGSGLFTTTGDGNGSAGPVSLRSGNGRFNKNNSTILSPTINRGLQQVSNTNVSGKTITQVAFCKKRHRICKNSQKIWNYH